MVISLESVILVDAADQAIGVAEKLAAHQLGLRHRAFSVVLQRRDSAGQVRVLLQQRQHTKYHCPGLWSNTCCSHPRPGEAILAAAERRLQEELGISGVALQTVGVFEYRVHLANGLIEHEVDHVLYGHVPAEEIAITCNPAEVAAVRWQGLTALLTEVEQSPAIYTPWCAQVFAMFMKYTG